MRKSFPIAACMLGVLSLGAHLSVFPQSETKSNSLQGQESLHAGVALKELKVPVGHKMLSFPIRQEGKVVADRANQGTHDPITVRCLVLQERQVSVALVLDAYQGLGAFPIDVRALDTDFLVGGTLKYLLSSAGTAMLYVRQELIERLTPTSSGWFAQRDINAMDIYANDPAPTARRFESGTPPVANIYAALAGVGLIQSWGVERIERHIRELTRAIKDGVLAEGFELATPVEDEAHGALLAVKVGDELAIVDALAQDDIVTSSRDGNVRISPHFYNNLEDIERLLESLRRNRQYML